MGSYKEINGDLIKMALDGEFDAIGHCTNCFCTMGGGIAAQMRNVFRCHEYLMEVQTQKGNIHKLGQIDWWTHGINRGDLTGSFSCRTTPSGPSDGGKRNEVSVVNLYGQYEYGRTRFDGSGTPLDYAALSVCFRKMNAIFKGMKIGLPYVIGCGLAGGDKDTVIRLIKKELKDCDVTMVSLK